MALQHRIRNVTAVLGPTNTGKTHLAIERMLGHQSGMIGLPLRLLAREVYDRIVAKVGQNHVALITGEEKIKPEHARYWVSTVEAMPRDIETDFLAIDEIQLAADPERGHVFTDRLLHARGREETLLLGAGTMRDAISELIPGANFISRPRLSKLTYSGQKKITRLPKRTAIVAFSAAEVYSIAELIRRQLGGAAVVLGALSPRTRNSQVALYQSGDVDYIVATDAIGMGLNLDVDHVAFAAVRKFDGHNYRNLQPAELAQVAGRAGRYMNEGTFGVTGDVEPLEADLIERLESHTFDTVRQLQWRNRELDFRTLDRLRESLRELPKEMRLQRARMADDVTALEAVSAVSEIADQASSPANVEKLWDVCQVPDYRKISTQNHAELVATLYGFLMSADGRIPEDWFSKQVAQADRTDGDIDTLANRIAHIRTWTFVSNRSWLADPEHWQQRTRAIEDSLSDALHEQLAQRFVDKRTSALMKGLRDKDEMVADIGSDGAITVENQYVGRLKGFRFSPDAQSDAQGIHGKATRNAASHVLAKELAMRVRRVASAKNDAFKLTKKARIAWRDEEIAQLEAGEDPLKPSVVLLADEHLTAPDREKVQQRLETWISETIAERLKPLMELKAAEDVAGLARGIAFRMTESFGVLKRDAIADEIRQLDQPARGQLRKYGVRFGAFNIFLPPLLKPAPAELTLVLWSLKHASTAGLTAESMPEPPRAGLTSIVTDPATPEAFYRAAGYHVCGPRAIRVDILERLADLIRPLLAWRKTEPNATPPKGSSGDGGFLVTQEMMSILGCSSEVLGSVLTALGFRSELRPAPVEMPAAAVTPAAIERAAVSAPEPAKDESELPDTAAEALAPPTEVSDAAAETPSEPVPDAVSAVVPTGVPMDEPVAVATEADAAAPEPAGKAEPADIKTIEIWRPRRRHREERRPRQGGRDQRQPAASGEAVAADGAPAAGERDQNRNRHRDRDRNRNHRPQGERGDRKPDGAGAPQLAPASSGPAVSPAAAESRPQERERKHEGRPNRPHGGKDRNRGDQRHEGRDRRRDDNRKGDRPRTEFRASAPGRKGGPDPDSPFAALSALKLQLEKQGKDSGGG